MNDGYNGEVATDRQQQDAHPGLVSGCAPALFARTALLIVAGFGCQGVAVFGGAHLVRWWLER